VGLLGIELGERFPARRAVLSAMGLITCELGRLERPGGESVERVWVGGESEMLGLLVTDLSSLFSLLGDGISATKSAQATRLILQTCLLGVWCGRSLWCGCAGQECCDERLFSA
jgi:tagatose-1,6-bisphosphate aldolase